MFYPFSCLDYSLYGTLPFQCFVGRTRGESEHFLIVKTRQRTYVLALREWVQEGRSFG